MSSTRPIVKIRPGKGQRLINGAPWVFADEIAMDRRTRALGPGVLVHLMEGEKSWGTAAFNSQSQIAGRLLDPDPGASIDAGWFQARLLQAQSLRQRLFDTPHYRLVHAEGDGLPGLVIDRFGDAVVVQPNTAWVDNLLTPLAEAVREVTGCQHLVINASARVRAREGLESYVRLAHGSLQEPQLVPMNGACYFADLLGGQKTGLFYDQRANHAMAARLARGGRVLDLFCHVGGFSLAALAAGADTALAIDSSAPALELAGRGAHHSGVASRFATERADAFDALAALAGEKPFDVVICDPPAFAPSKSALAAGLRAYERLARLAAPLVARDGVLVMCSCSHAVSVDAFHHAAVAGMLRAGRQGALIHSGRAGPDHPIHMGLPETGYLKALFYRLAF